MKFATTGVAKNKALVTTDWIGIEFENLSLLAGIQPYFYISKRTHAYFSSKWFRYVKEALKSPMSTGKYFGWMKLQGLDVVLSYLQGKLLFWKVFPSNIMDIINTHRIFHYNEYCFVNNAVEIAPPIINIIPIWPSNITDIVRNQCRDIVSTDYI